MIIENLVADWSSRLGLAGTKLFGHSTVQSNAYAMLDGIDGSFTLGDRRDGGSAQLDWTWSANMTTHVDVGSDDIIVRQVDPRSKILKFSRDQVDRNLEKFFDTILLARVAPAMSATDHITYCFRSHHRTATAAGLSAHQSLAHFLSMLRSALDHTSPVIDERLPSDHFSRFSEELFHNRLMNRHLDLGLTMRHAAGMVFQEAHAELTSESITSIQPQLFGLEPAPTLSTRNRLGAYYTPPGLARVLCEIAIKPHLEQDELTIMDPACGSGLWLNEVLHALDRENYRGRVRLIGYDLSGAAIEMARFAIEIGIEGRSNVEVQLTQADFTTLMEVEAADIILMNPPFTSFEDMTPEQQTGAKRALGDAFGYRPDLSMVFISSAIDALAPGGSIATLLPSGVLVQANGLQWRRQVVEATMPELIAVLGDHGLFKDAMVNIGALVLHEGRKPVNPTMLWASQKHGASSSALRRLRRWSIGAKQPERRADWAIYPKPSSERIEEGWLPRPKSLGDLPAKLARTPNVVTVADLFHVELGVRVGKLSDSIQITASAFEQLPPEEKGLFRPVAETKSIRMGSVLPVSYLFYPPQPMSLDEVVQAAPVFSSKHIHGMTDPATLIEAERARRKTNDAMLPKIVSRAYLGVGSFAPDADGRFVVVQGHAWKPKTKITQAAFDLGDLLGDYSFILNSRLFFSLAREHGRIVGGGQVEGAQQYMNKIPLPDLAEIYLSRPDLLDRAAGLRQLDRIEYPETAALDAFAAEAYGTDLKEWAHPK